MNYKSDLRKMREEFHSTKPRPGLHRLWENYNFSFWLLKTIVTWKKRLNKGLQRIYNEEIIIFRTANKTSTSIVPAAFLERQCCLCCSIILLTDVVSANTTAAVGLVLCSLFEEFCDILEVMKAISKAMKFSDGDVNTIKKSSKKTRYYIERLFLNNCFEQNEMF